MLRRIAIPLAGIVAMCSLIAASTAAATIGVEPDCPAPTDAITVSASGPTVQREPLSLTLDGTTIRLVAQAYNPGFTLPPYTEVRVALAPLPPGKYRIEFYTRIQPTGAPGGDSSSLLPQRFHEAQDFEVYHVPPTCRATSVELVNASFASAEVGHPYSEVLQFRATDAHGNLVPNWTLWVNRVRPPSEPSNSDPAPDLAQPPWFITTGADGIATLRGNANQVPGAFQYRATLGSSNRAPTVAYVAFYNRPVGSSSPTHPVVEFVRNLPNRMQHFFMTGNSVEAVQLDYSQDWQRTGEVYMTFAPGSSHAGTSPVCRFYGLPSAGLDSHFFSAAPDECDAVRQRFADAWQLETTNAFEVYLPNRVTGAGPPGTRRLYRGYNNQLDANHRYAFTHNVAVLNAHPEGGPYWSLEGYGEDAVVMCLPQ